MAKAATKERSAMECLQDMRKELATAEQELATAEAAMNLDAVINLRQRVDAARTLIRTLESTVRVELEDQGKEKAKAWVGKRAAALTKATKAVAAAQVEVRAAIEAAVTAIQREAQARKSIEHLAAGAEVLSLRFGLGDGKTRHALPPLIDWVGPLITATDAMRPSRQTRLGLTVASPLSATAEQRRREELRAVGQFMKRAGASLPEDVRTILAEAPLPVDDSAVRPRMSEREEQEARVMAALVKDTEFAMRFRSPSGI